MQANRSQQSPRDTAVLSRARQPRLAPKFAKWILDFSGVAGGSAEGSTPSTGLAIPRSASCKAPTSASRGGVVGSPSKIQATLPQSSNVGGASSISNSRASSIVSAESSCGVRGRECCIELSCGSSTTSMRSCVALTITDQCEAAHTHLQVSRQRGSQPNAGFSLPHAPTACHAIVRSATFGYAFASTSSRECPT
jgi:hypothetical protein